MSRTIFCCLNEGHKKPSTSAGLKNDFLLSIRRLRIILYCVVLLLATCGSTYIATIVHDRSQASNNFVLSSHGRLQSRMTFKISSLCYFPRLFHLSSRFIRLSTKLVAEARITLVELVSPIGWLTLLSGSGWIIDTALSLLASFYYYALGHITGRLETYSANLLSSPIYVMA